MKSMLMVCGQVQGPGVGLGYMFGKVHREDWVTVTH